MLRVPFQFAARSALLANAMMLAPFDRSMIELDCNVNAPIPGTTDQTVYSLRPPVLNDAVADPIPFKLIPALSLIRSIVSVLLKSNVPPLFTVMLEVPLAVEPSAFGAAAFSVPALIVVAPVYVFALVRTSVPGPIFVRLPAPLIFPAMVNVLPLLSNRAVTPLAILMLRVAASVTFPDVS